MLKAMVRGKQNEPIYVLGLTPELIRLLQHGVPLFVQGAELGLRHHWFLILRAWSEDDVQRQHQRHAGELPTGEVLHTIAVSAEVLAQLSGRPLWVEAKTFDIDGDLVLLYGTTIVELSELIDMPIETGELVDRPPVLAWRQ